MTYNYRWRWHL